MNDFIIDSERETRTGVSEALMCEWKTPQQIDAILRASPGRMLATRLSSEKFDALSADVRTALDYDPRSRTAFLGGPHMAPPQISAGIVCAGSSDLPIAGEAARTLAFHGFAAPLVADVGVAGLWRLMRRLDEIRALTVVIAVAGMEGALFSVLAGLIDAPLIAVPASVGYGVARDGGAALSSALASCSPGILVVNIDNGFGAACAAIKILKLAGR